MQYKFQITNEEAQKCRQASSVEEVTAEHFRFGGEYRETELYRTYWIVQDLLNCTGPIKKGDHNVLNRRNDISVIKWT